MASHRVQPAIPRAGSASTSSRARARPRPARPVVHYALIDHRHGYDVCLGGSEAEVL